MAAKKRQAQRSDPEKQPNTPGKPAKKKVKTQLLDGNGVDRLEDILCWEVECGYHYLDLVPLGGNEWLLILSM